MFKLEPDPNITGSAGAFREWLRANRYSTSKFASDFGYSQASIAGYACGRQIPRLRVAMDIYRITGGAVKLEEWVI